jgi:hypothetical protein
MTHLCGPPGLPYPAPAHTDTLPTYPPARQGTEEGGQKEGRGGGGWVRGRPTAEEDAQKNKKATAVGVDEEEDKYIRNQKTFAHNRQKLMTALAGMSEALLFQVRAGQWLSMSDALQVEMEARAAHKARLVRESPKFMAAYVIQKRWRKVM